MKKEAEDFPAISHELKFIAENVDEADDIYEQRVEIDKYLEELSNKIYRRADDEIRELLDRLKSSVESGVAKILRINEWRAYQPWSWEIWSPIYNRVGRKRRMGSTGLSLKCGQGSVQLVGWVNPPGGLHGRTQFTRSCQKKFPNVHLVSESYEKYPDWDDVVVWFEERLTLKTSQRRIQAQVTTQAGRFFRFASPLLDER